MKNHFIFLAAIALMAVSCLGKSGYYNATYNAVANFEYSDLDDESFGADSLYVPTDEAFAGGGCMAFFNTKDGSGNFQGGCALSLGCDPNLREGYIAGKPWLLYLPKKSENANNYMVVKFSDEMPEKTVELYVPSEESTIAPSFMFVNNCVQMVNAVRYGTGLEGGPFVKDDWVKLTVKGLREGAVTGTKDFSLADFKTYQDSVVTSWTEVDLSELSNVDQLEFSLTSSRADIPAYVCMDNISVKLNVVY